MVNAPDTLDKVLRDLDRGLAILRDKAEHYASGKAYYDGTKAEVFANAAISKALNDEARAHPLNLSHIPVDAVIDKVNLTAIAAAEESANKRLAEVLDANDVEDEADDWARKAGYFGDYYVIIDITEVDEATDAATNIEVLGASPLSTVMVYKGKDGRTPLFAVRKWTEGKTPHASVHYHDLDCLLIGTEGSDGYDAKGFSPDLDDDGDEDSYRVPHPGNRILVVHYAVDGKPYGTPLHRKAWGPQDAITKISATNLATVDAQGFPTRYALLDPKAEADDDIDDDFGDDGLERPGNANGDGQTKPTNGSKLKTGPGLIHMLAGIKSVGQWDAAEAGGFLLNLDWYTRAMAVATGTPMFEFDLSGEQPSGESRRRASARLNKHARKVMRAIGKAHETLGDTILAVLGIEATVTATFQPVETETDKEGLELVGEKVKQGVPLRTALLEAGYSTDQVNEWWPENAPAIPPSLWQQLGALLTQLGQAQALGAINDAETAALLPNVLTGARGEGPEIGDPDEPELEVETPEAVKAKAEALGALVRAGADQAEAAAKIGLSGVSFPNVPTTVRIPEADAAGLEQQGAAATP
jgi:hypothetical protein